MIETALDMFHADEIAQAVRLICQGAVALTEDAHETDTVKVGSNQLFAVGQQVWVCDEQTPGELHTISGKSGLTGVELEAEVLGEFAVARGAMMRLATSPGPVVRHVTRGKPAAIPQPNALQVPCVVVESDGMEQPVAEGTNRSFRQDYTLRVHYIRRSGQGEDDERQTVTEAGKLFNLLMQDTYLGGSCWHSQVTRVEIRGGEEAELRSRGADVRVVSLELLARRAEMWMPS